MASALNSSNNLGDSKAEYRNYAECGLQNLKNIRCGFNEPSDEAGNPVILSKTGEGYSSDDIFGKGELESEIENFEIVDSVSLFAPTK